MADMMKKCPDCGAATSLNDVRCCVCGYCFDSDHDARVSEALIGAIGRIADEFPGLLNGVTPVDGSDLVQTLTDIFQNDFIAEAVKRR